MPKLTGERGGLLTALGLHRRELRAWALYDWANSAFVTTVMAAVLPIYYHQVAAVGLPENLRTAYWGYTQTIALAIIALSSPILGAMADYLGAKKKFLAFFAFSGVVGSALLYFVERGDWMFASAAFIVGNIGFAAGEVFYESLLPHIARPDEIDRVSTAGYALGYVGGGLLLAAQLAWISSPDTFGMADSAEASRVAFATVAAWWGVFTIPILRSVREPAVSSANVQRNGGSPVRFAFQRVFATLREVRRRRQVFLFLLAFWFYNDGINTIIKMATIYGAEIGIGETDLIGALLLVQFVGIPCTFAFGALAARIGAKNGIYLALAVYTAVAVFGYFISTAWHFWVLACGVAVVQGGSQALSRSLFATLIPANKSSQFFGFYNITGKFGNLIGPFVFAVVSEWTGGSRMSILALVFFFLTGMVLLSRVDVEQGREAARAETSNARLQPT